MSLGSPPGSRHRRKASPLCLSHGWGTPVPFVCCLVVTRSRGRHLRDRQKLLWVFYFSLKWKRFRDRKRRLPLLVSPPRDWKPRELFICPGDVCVWWKEQVQRSLVYISFPLGLWMQAKRSDKEVENSRHCPGCLYWAFLECLRQILKQISINIFPSLLQLWCQENLKILVLMDKQKRIVVTERKKPIRSTTYLHDRSTQGRKTLLRDFEMQDITWCKDCA